MRLNDLAKGSSVFLGVIVAGYVSTVYVDQRLAPPPKAASESKDPPTPTNSQPPADGGSACIGEGGSWKNWPWPNVPMGSPKCK
ncbi:hypothetical protein [Bradyrhizobium guangdongense]|uniref:Uncharacterized protein n=1 Tax=Bradyrhizobium guangdongense TaxID=1325090 RepID=A0A410V198_9BRAD|nr:hypothetical protein [Bradyrhizobium guangdongense]QAU37449.1 hypothetical protein X265_06970 [Bradyrhizobium guangdongense]QOZ58507.1 hypothetical protein XH86_06970 [Bradyrhizobium guangdongense]GGI20333.1 hypothetical protein GCM10010987_08830 [Bradyrhizobium guangdongense]